MLFSTKAEYGVRLMVELGRQPGSAPVSLSAVAEAERLPLSYLEHLVAKLRKAGLVTSTRGAHGGYRLAKPAEEITMDAGGRGAGRADRPDGVLPRDARGQGPLLARETTATAPVRRSCSGRASRAASPRRSPAPRWPSWSSSPAGHGGAANERRVGSAA